MSRGQEPPQYERTQGIVPGAQSVDFSVAMRGSESFAKALGAIGAQIAQRASNQQATQLGIEAAQNPGRTLLPDINEATAHFNEAYKNEEYKVLQFEGEKYLSNIYNDLASDPNPTSESLLEFEKNAQNGIQSILGQSKGPHASELKRHFEKVYNSQFMDLSNKVEASNRRYLKEQTAAQLEQSSDGMVTAIRNGDVELGQSYFNQSLKNLYESAAINNTPLEKVAIQEQQLRSQYLSAQLQKGYIDSPNKDKPKYLAEARDNLPEDMSAEDKDSIVAGLEQFSRKYDSAFKGQQYLNYNQAKMKIASREFTASDLADLEDKVNAYQLSDLEIEATKVSAAESRNLSSAQEILKYSDNPVFLANQSDKNINYTVDSVILPQAEAEKGEPLSLSEQAMVLSNFKTPVPSLSKRLSAAIRDGSPMDLVDASIAVSFAQANNPALIRNMSKDDIAVANLYQSISKNPKYSGEEGAIRARDSVYNLTPEIKEERQRKVDAYYKSKELNTSKGAIREASKSIQTGFFSTTKKLPAGASTVYLDILRNEIMRSGDPVIAEKMAKDQMKEIYQETDINNISGEVMVNAPEKAYPNLGYVLKNDMVRALKGVVDSNKQMQANGDFVFTELDWENAPDTSNILDEPIHQGDLKIKINGKERKVVVISDLATQFSPVPQATYAFAYLDDNGISQPILSPTGKGTPYRWIPDSGLYKDIVDNYPNIQLKIAQEIKRKAQAIHPSDKDLSTLQGIPLNE